MKTTSLLLSAILVLGPAMAAELTVTSSADDGDGTLRAAFASAADGDTIAIPEGMAVTLAAEILLPKINVSVVGQGEGATISGGDATRMFHANGEALHSLRLSNLSIVNGRSTLAAVLFADRLSTTATSFTLTLENCLVADNVATDGSNVHGACFQNDRIGLALYATNCTFRGNVGGGSVFGTSGNYTPFGGDVVFSHCTFNGNGSDNADAPAGAFCGGLFYGPAVNLLFDGCVMTNIVIGSSRPAIFSDEFARAPVHAATFRNCTVQDVTMTGTGESSILFNLSGVGTNRFENCSFRSCSSPIGNLVGYIGTAVVEFEDVLIEDCSAAERTEAWNRGGLFFIRGNSNVGVTAAVSFRRCVFRRNQIGASCVLFKTYALDGGLVMEDCLVENNASYWGQILSAASGPSVSLTRCSFIGNSRLADSTATSSQAMFPLINGAGVTNCTIAANIAPGVRPIFNSNIDLNSCTIVSNQTGYSSIYGVIADTRIVNCVFTGNSPYDVYGDANHATFDFSGIRSSRFETDVIYHLADRTTVTEGGNAFGLSASDLGLVFPPAGNNSKISLPDGTSPLTIAFGGKSPLRNAGLVSASPLTDGRGFLRAKDGSEPDIGAYELVSQNQTVLFVQ